MKSDHLFGTSAEQDQSEASWRDMGRSVGPFYRGTRATGMPPVAACLVAAIYCSSLGVCAVIVGNAKDGEDK